MKIGILTSSRADYGIYQPLLKRIANDDFFDLNLLVFGTHLSEKFGKTIRFIKSDGYPIAHEIETLPDSDSPFAVSRSMAKTIYEFSQVWNEDNFDLIFALGDRYEMFAAVSSTLPFNIPVAHIHGGETTLGAMDNSFRHAITLMSKYHFVAAEPYKKRVIEILGSKDNVYNVGALSIDNIMHLTLMNVAEFKIKFNIDISIPTILITFHPETIHYEKNKESIEEIVDALKELDKYQLVITMPNADTMGLYIREHLTNFIRETPTARGVESFGSLGYLSCMKHCKMMLGNTSSGFIEAAGLNKPVVNLGNRQKGRIVTPNIFNTPCKKNEILSAVKQAEKYNKDDLTAIYGEGMAAEKIVKVLKELTL